jgi:hypothetical protein
MPHITGIAGVALTFLVLGTLTAEAQRTCSAEFKSCASRARYARTCLLAKEDCMKTGRWIGPETGKDYGPHRKE